MQKYGFVYIWFDKKHKRYYVGSHWGTKEDGYICSSSWMKQAYKHRPEDFKRRILIIIETTHQDLLNEEQRWLDMIKDIELSNRYYNKRRRAMRNPFGIKFPNRKRPSTPNYAKGKTNPKAKSSWNTRQKYPCIHCEKMFYKWHLSAWHNDLCLSNPNLNIEDRHDQINRRMMNARTDESQMKKSKKLKDKPQTKTSYCISCEIWSSPHVHARYHNHELDQ